jgi:uncharacterized protein (DUF1778 family)
MARPEKQEAERRGTYVMIRLTKEEKELVAMAAKKARLATSDFARLVVLDETARILRGAKEN